MNTLYLILFFIFGLIIGSFCNVVAFRRSKNESIIYPRSHCPNCNHTLSPIELIPVFSYLIQKGRCKHCKEKISVFYPINEILTAVLFMISYYVLGFSWNLVLAIVLSTFFVIVVVTDLNYYIIPDEITIFYSIVILIINAFRFGTTSYKYLIYGLIMFLFMYLLMKIGNLLFKQESLGGGDIKLLFALGLTQPLITSFFAIALACFIALPISGYFYFKKKDKIIPFGPFLIIAFLILLLLNIEPTSLYNFLFPTI